MDGRPPPWADHGRLAELGALQPLTALGAAIPGVATWKPGAYSPLVRVRGTVARAGWLGEILLVLLQEDDADAASDGERRLVGLMLKPRCGLDSLRALIGARCEPSSAPTGRGKLPLREYRRQQRDAAAAAAAAAAVAAAAAGAGAAPADSADSSAATASGQEQAEGDAVAAAAPPPLVRLELEAFVEKSKTQFLLRKAGLGCAGGASPPEASRVLPVVLHPAHARWSPGDGEDGSSAGFCEWTECGLEPSGSGSDWTATGETHVHATELSDAYLAQLRAWMRPVRLLRRAHACHCMVERVSLITPLTALCSACCWHGDGALLHTGAAKNGEGKGWGAVPGTTTAATSGAAVEDTDADGAEGDQGRWRAATSDSEDDARDFVERMSGGGGGGSGGGGLVVSHGVRTRQLYNQRKHHRTKAKKNRFAEFAQWVAATFPDEVGTIVVPPSLSARWRSCAHCKGASCTAEPAPAWRRLSDAAGLQVLYAGRGCLDVAGGKGSLAYELAVVNAGTPEYATARFRSTLGAWFRGLIRERVGDTWQLRE